MKNYKIEILIGFLFEKPYVIIIIAKNTFYFKEQILEWKFMEMNLFNSMRVHIKKVHIYS